MAEIKFPCPGCQVTLKVSDTLAGKKIKCPKCAAIATIPAASAPLVPPPVAAVPERPFVPMAQPVAPPPPAVLSASPVELYHPDDKVRLTPRAAAPSTTRKAKPKSSGVFVAILAGLLVIANVAAAVVVYLGILLPVPAALPTPEANGTTPPPPNGPPIGLGVNGPSRNPGGLRTPIPKPPDSPEKIGPPEKPSPLVLDEIQKFAEVKMDDEGLRVVVNADATSAQLFLLAKLPKQTKRYVLDLSKMTELDDPGLGYLRGLTDLTDLDLSGAKHVFDSGVAHLMGLKKLQTLNLSGVEKVDDVGLDYLTGLTGLKKITLTGTKVTDDGVAKFKAALPKVEIVR